MGRVFDLGGLTSRRFLAWIVVEGSPDWFGFVDSVGRMGSVLLVKVVDC